MTSCLFCGANVDEWELVTVEVDGKHVEMCKDCDLERQGFFDDDDTPDDDDQAELAEKAELALSCRCGAWLMRDGKPKHCGDCVCGAQ